MPPRPRSGALRPARAFRAFGTAFPALLLLGALPRHADAGRRAAPAGGRAPRTADPLAPLAGRWALDGARSDDPRDAVERTVASLNFLMRRPARARLRALNAAYPSVDVSLAGDTVRVTFAGLPPLVARRDGSLAHWRDADGGSFELRGAVVPVLPGELAEREGTPAVPATGPLWWQRLAGPAGERWNLLGVTPDGATLVLHVQVSAPRLQRPVRYALVYRRAAR